MIFGGEVGEDFVPHQLGDFDLAVTSAGLMSGGWISGS
jgi:hypothetical protein